MNPFFLPEIAAARFVRMYFFRHPQQGPSSCALVTDCRSYSAIQYAHVMYIYEGGDIIVGKPVWAVTSEVNRMATPGSGRSHFLCTFSDGAHSNLDAADDWADMDKFAARALALIAAHYKLAQPPEEMPVPTLMVQRYQVPRVLGVQEPPAEETGSEPAKTKTRKWWQLRK